MKVLRYLAGRSRRSRRFLVSLCALLAALAVSSVALADTVVTYFDGVAIAATAYSNQVLGNKTYNEMFASSNQTSGDAVGIYLLTSGGSKIRAFNALGFVFWGPVSDANAEYARAFCWNRYTSINFSASCWYQRP
jgi:hypothetical protein